MGWVGKGGTWGMHRQIKEEEGAGFQEMTRENPTAVWSEPQWQRTSVQDAKRSFSLLRHRSHHTGRAAVVARRRNKSEVESQKGRTKDRPSDYLLRGI